jgi:hypothetical protein
LLTGESKAMRSTRQCCLLPTVARRKRATIIRDLEVWLKRPENRYDQFMLFTGGVRVPVGVEGRRAVQIMGRALSKLNSKPFMKRRGCFFVLRSIEIGKMADEFGNVICNEAGVALAHVHAHVLMHQPGWFSPEEQAALTRDITRCWNKLMASAESKNPFWGWSGSLESIRECVKYVCKTDALLALDGANLRRTHEMLFRLHRVQPLGAFKRERAARYARILKVGSRFVAEKGAREKLVPWVHKDWNCTKRTRLKTEEQKRAEKARLEARKARKERIAAMHADNRFKAWMEGRDTLKERQAVWWEKPLETAPETASEPPEPMGQKRKTVISNRIFARLAPAPYFGRTWAPAVLVWNYQPERKAEVLAEWHALPWIRDAVEAVRDIVAKARQLEADELLAEMRPPAAGDIGCPRLDRNCPPAAGPPGGGFDPLPGSKFDPNCKKTEVLS